MINVIQNTIGSLARRGSETPSFTGLLDTYSGAAVGYSLRRLSGSYNGDAIIVRRSSDNVELAIGFDSNNVLDESALLTHVGAGNDGYVTTWYDQSGNGNNAIQSADANQPKIVVSGSVSTDTDSKPAILFASGNRFEASAVNLSQPITAFTLHNASVFNKSVYDGSSDRCLLRNTSLSSIKIYSGAFLSASGTSSSRKLTYGLHNSTSSEVAFNNSSVGSGNSGTQGLDTLKISASGADYVGLMQEMVFYGSNQSSNKVGIFSNINTNYTVY